MLTDRPSRVTAMDQSYIQEREQQLERDAKKRRGLRRRLGVLALFTVILGTLCFVTIYTQGVTLKEKRLEQANLEEQLQQLQVEEKQLHTQIKNYNDLNYIGEIARRDYYLSKPGETLFKLPE